MEIPKIVGAGLVIIGTGIGIGLIGRGAMDAIGRQPDASNKILVAAIVIAALVEGIAFAALLLILPGFATDLLGFLLIFPLTRKLFFGKFLKKFKKETTIKKPYIEGEFEDIDDNNDRKI